MADQGLTHDDLIPGLADIRLPADAPGGFIAEVAVAVGIGLLLAICISAVLPLFMRRRKVAKEASLKDQIALAATLPKADQAVTLLHILKQRDAEAAKAFAQDIYRPGGVPDVDALMAKLSRAETSDA